MATKIDLRTGVALALGTVLATSGAGIAQDQPPSGAVIEEQASSEILSEDLIGLTIVTQQDGTETSIGAVEALLFDEDDALTGVIVGVGGFLGFGSKQVALSYDALDMQVANGEPTAAVVDMNREQLENAPEFKTQAALRQERERERIEQEVEQQQQQQRQSDSLQ